MNLSNACFFHIPKEVQDLLILIRLVSSFDSSYDSFRYKVIYEVHRKVKISTNKSS